MQDDATGKRIVVANVHTVDGQGDHSITGSKKQRDRFKARALENVLRQVVRESPSRAAGEIPTIIGGDFNIHRDEMKEALRSITQLDKDATIFCAGDDTMWVLSESSLQSFEFNEDIRGLDNQHPAIGVRVVLGQPAATVIRSELLTQFPFCCVSMQGIVCVVGFLSGCMFGSATLATTQGKSGVTRKDRKEKEEQKRDKRTK